MKIQDYNQMMAYLTRPAIPTEIPDTRQQAASGGVIGEGGMFQGEDLGNRTGFAKPIQITQGTKKNQWMVESNGIRTYFPTEQKATKFNTEKNLKNAIEKNKRLKKIRKLTSQNNIEYRNKINNWVKNWFDQNVTNEKYNLRDGDKAIAQLKKDFINSENLDPPEGLNTKKLSEGFPNITNNKMVKGIKTQGLSLYGSNSFARDTGQEYKVSYDNFFKKAFLNKKLTDNPILKNRVEDYMKYISTNKMSGTGPKLKEINNQYADVLNNLDDVTYILGSDTGLQGRAQSTFLENTFQNFKPYQEKRSKGMNYRKNVALIEKTLGPKKLKEILNGSTSIMGFMRSEGNKLKKIFDTSKLPPELVYSLDHNIGIADISRGSKNQMEQYLRSMIGMTNKRNYDLGFKKYSSQKKKLLSKINEGTDIQKNVAELNELTKKVYPELKEKNAYQINKTGKISVTEDFIFPTTEEQRFKQYFGSISEDKKYGDIAKKELANQATEGSELKKLLSQMKKNGLPKTAADEVTEALQTMQNKFGSGLDPMDVARWAKAELGVIQEIGAKYGGKVFNNLAAIDVPIAQVLFAKEVTDFSEDSPLWTTLPMAFTDEVAKYYNLYDRSGGKISNFIKLAASSGVPAKLAKTIFPIVSKAGKLGSTYALPALQLAQEGYNEYDRRKKIDYEGEKFERLFPDKISKDKMMEDYRQDQRDRVPELTDDMDVPEISERGQQNLDSIKRGAQSLGSLFGLADDPYAYNKPNIAGTPLVSSETMDDYLDREYKADDQGYAVKIEDVVEEYNNGGRVGYADGPKDPKRRTIIKGLTALAAVPFVGRYFKLAKPVDKAISGVQTVIEKVKGLPDWFQPFVNKVLKEGKDVTDEAATIEREIVKRVDIEDATVDVHYNTATNDVRVEIVGGKNALDDPLQIDYKAPEIIEETGKKTKGSFSAVESKPQPIQIGADDFDIETGENVTDVLDDLLSETDYLEGFATGKIRTPKEIARAKKRTMHRENMKKNPTDYVVDPSEGNPYAMGDYEKFYETVTDLDGIDDLLDLKYLKKK